jgi:hypothetical protein
MKRDQSAPSPLYLMKLFDFQEEIKAAPHQFKISRWGRRTGKSRAVVHCAITGHGPVMPDGKPKWRGLAQGKNVLWIGPDYKQLANIWNEEIYPRFNGATNCDTNENEMTAWLGDARFIFRTGDKGSHTAIRGLGKNLGGIIVDEAAHLDLEALMLDVILPMTLDEDGWIWLPSTTNGSSDGHLTEDGAKRTPSYYNILCEQQLAGESPDWFQSHKYALDNPLISRAAFARLVKQYENQPVKLQQEVYAALLRGGAGFAFPEIKDDVHLVPHTHHDIVELVGGVDWGYAKHGYIGLIGLTAIGTARLLWEMPFNGPIPELERMDPEQVGFVAGKALLQAYRPQHGELPQLPRVGLDLFYCDSAMNAVSEGHESQMTLMQRGFDRAMGDRAPTLIEATKGAGSRRARKSVLHAMLKYTELEAENGVKVVVERPKLTMTPKAPFFLRTTKQLMIEPKDPEDVDTTGPDHAYDAVTYALLMCFPDLVVIARSHVPSSADKLSRQADREFEAAADPANHRKPTARVYG